MRAVLTVCALAVFAGATAVYSQTFTASVLGVVSDASGAAIPNAAVTATNVATNVHTETRSDSTGRYLLPQLQPGAYRVDAMAAGFKKYLHSGIELNVGQQAQIDIAMAVGEVTENVTVEGTVSAIETASSTVGKVVSNRAILNLPLNSRNVYSLIFPPPTSRAFSTPAVWPTTMERAAS
ncbi:MAG: carboxypeptidase-like regulatory domain-containing protein [Candidatus Solibacter sp.]